MRTFESLGHCMYIRNMLAELRLSSEFSIASLICAFHGRKMSLFMTMQMLASIKTLCTVSALQSLFRAVRQHVGLQMRVPKKRLCTTFHLARERTDIIMRSLMLLKQTRPRICLVASCNITQVLLGPWLVTFRPFNRRLLLKVSYRKLS